MNKTVYRMNNFIESSMLNDKHIIQAYRLYLQLDQNTSDI